MLRRASILLAAIPMGVAYSQQPATPAAPIAVPGAAVQPGSPDKLSDADLEELLAPVALYPDPLLANVMAASVYPDEVAAAAKMAGADAAKIDAQSWEEPVKAVAKVPDAIKMMGQYADWTKALGQAYIVQSQDVMKAVQTLRARAQANGALQTSPQQTVTSQGDTIIIQPAQPEVIYVPTYSPAVVYAPPPSSGDAVAAGIIGFGVGVAVGAIIGNMDCDWHGGCCCWGGGHNDVDIDVNRNVNINNNFNNTNIKNTNIGREGGRWEPNASKSSVRPGSGYDRGTLNSYKGVGEGTRQASIPSRQANAAPIASRPAPARGAAPAAANRPANVPDRPAAKPVNRPAAQNAAGPKASAPAARPSADASRPAPSKASLPASRPSSSPSVYSGSGGGSQAAASRGAASRSGGGGGARGGGGGRGGGGRR